MEYVALGTVLTLFNLCKSCILVNAYTIFLQLHFDYQWFTDTSICQLSKFMISADPYCDMYFMSIPVDLTTKYTQLLLLQTLQFFCRFLWQYWGPNLSGPGLSGLIIYFRLTQPGAYVSDMTQLQKKSFKFSHHPGNSQFPYSY